MMLRTNWALTLAVIFTFVFAILMFGRIMLGDGTISIEPQYYDDYQSCVQDYNSLLESKTPECAPVDCSESTTLIGTVYWILGMLLLASGWWFNFDLDKKRDAFVKEKNDFIDEKYEWKRSRRKK